MALESEQWHRRKNVHVLIVLSCSQVKRALSLVDTVISSVQFVSRYERALFSYQSCDRDRDRDRDRGSIGRNCQLNGQNKKLRGDWERDLFCTY